VKRKRRQFGAGTGMKSINHRVFHDFREAFQLAQSSFCLADWL
jgi:hypothetical protein